MVAFDYLTCKASSSPLFDVNGNGVFNPLDLISFAGALANPGSKVLTGITPPGTRVYNPGSGVTYVYNSSSAGGNPQQDKIHTPNPGGRVSWRILDKNQQR